MKNMFLCLALSVVSFVCIGQQAPIMKAIRDNNVERLQALIASGADVNAQYDMPNTLQIGLDTIQNTVPVIYASCKGKASLLKALIAAGANVNYQRPNRPYFSTALMIAASQGYIETLKLLIDAGANVNTQDDAGRTALTHAFLKRQYQAAELLIDAGTQLDTVSPWGEQPITQAARANQSALLKKMIDNQANVNAPNVEGYTPLSDLFVDTTEEEEEQGGDIKPAILKMLLNAGARFNAGQAGLISAVLNANFATTVLLIRKLTIGKFIAIYKKEPFRNYLVWFKLSNNSDKIRLLNLLGANNDIKLYLKNPFSYIKEHVSSNYFSMLDPVSSLTTVTQGVGSKRTHEGALVEPLGQQQFRVGPLEQTALMWAALFGHTGLVKMCLPRFSLEYIRAKDLTGKNALMYAALAENRDIVKLLLTNEAVRKTIHTKSSEGFTALDYAVRSGDKAMIVMLLESGARITTNTVFNAAEAGHYQIAAYLWIEKRVLMRKQGKVRLLNPEETDEEAMSYDGDRSDEELA